MCPRPPAGRRRAQIGAPAADNGCTPSPAARPAVAMPLPFVSIAARASAHRSRLAVAWAAALAATAAMAGAGGVTPLRWDAQGRFATTLVVAGGGHAELCGRLGAGDAVAWRFDADAPTDFDIHYHEGAAVRHAARLWSSEGAADRFVAPGARTYCWMWRNPLPTPVTLSAALERRRGR